MRTAFRLTLSFLAAFVVLHLTSWMSMALIALFGPFWLGSILSLVAAIAAGRFVWRWLASVESGLLPYMAAGALILGGLGFVGGFFGPMFLGGGNQGPLLGLLITGPLGFVLGAAGGFFYGRTREGSSCASPSALRRG